MTTARKRIALILVGLAFSAWFAWLVIDRLRGANTPMALEEAGAAPVEVAPVEHGVIEWRRVFSGTLESPGEFVVAPKISGRIEHLAVDLADPVKRNQIVAELDDDEYVQAVLQAEAELAVTQANLNESISSLEIAERELSRVQTLTSQGIGSESALDVARADQLARQAAVKVAEAQVMRAEALLSTTRIRLGYTKVAATWTGGDDERVVAQRHVEEGDTVAANSPLLTIVELDPITAVIYLTGRDYGRLRSGQPVSLTTDAYPGEVFTGTVSRVAPVFEQASRQARAELTVANPRHALKPGMFVRAETILDRAESATIVPVAAITTRDGKTGVFVVNRDGTAVSWKPVTVAITDNDRVQVLGEGVFGRVVTLGQQLLDDGSAIVIPQRETSARSPFIFEQPTSAFAPCSGAGEGSLSNTDSSPALGEYSLANKRLAPRAAASWTAAVPCRFPTRAEKRQGTQDLAEARPFIGLMPPSAEDRLLLTSPTSG